MPHAAAAPARLSFSYERWIKPPTLGREEWQLLRLVRTWGREHNARLQLDARLSQVARTLLPQVPETSGQSFNMEHARRALQRLGWTDGQLAAVALHVPKGQDVGRALKHELDTSLAKVEVNRIGLASIARPHGTVLLALFSRRLVDLEPFPARVAGRDILNLNGRLRVPAQAGSLAIAAPNDSIRQIPLELKGRSFSQVLALGSAPGVTHLEIMLDRGKGPEIAAILPVGVGEEPFSDPSPETLALRDADSDPEAAIASLILGARAARDIPLLATSAALAQIARSHAEEMRDSGFFAHVSPTTGDVTQRLGQQGVRYARALENLAASDAVERVWQQWMASPAHRANLLDPDVTTLGVGVATQILANGTPRLFAVAVLTRLADEGDDRSLADQALTHLNSERSRKGLPSLRAHPRLAELATQHSREMAVTRQVSDTSPTRGSVVDVVFQELDMSEAALDVYRADAVAVVSQSPHLRERFTRAGIGVVRDRRHDGPQLWITVIYGAD